MNFSFYRRRLLNCNANLSSNVDLDSVVKNTFKKVLNIQNTFKHKYFKYFLPLDMIVFHSILNQMFFLVTFGEKDADIKRNLIAKYGN